MTDPDQTVFLCYRREVSWALARLVHDNLNAHGFDVFIDVTGIGGGEFERVLLREIAARTYFLVLLEPRSLDRLAEPDDWLRREIAHALAHGRNVVPLLVSGATMPRAQDLPVDIARLQSYNALPVSHEYFDAAMQELRDHFLPPASVPMREEPSAPAPPSATFVRGPSPIPETAWHEPVAPPAGKSTAEEPVQATRPGPPPADPSKRQVQSTASAAGRRMGSGVGRTREIDPVHRRGGLGVLVLVLAVVSGGAIWAGSGGSGGRGLATAAGTVAGLGAVVLPVLLFAVGIVLVTTEGHPEARPRLVVGSALFALGALGLVHIWAGLPNKPERWAEGGGALGYLASIPLAGGLTVWVAVPVLIALTGYALLLLLDTPLREVPERFRRLTGRAEPWDDDLT